MINELLCRFVAGGSLIVLITLLSKSKHPALAGIFMLFPAVTLVGYYFVGQDLTSAQLQPIIKFSVYALSTTFVFLITLYYVYQTQSMNTSLCISVISWLISAYILIKITNIIGS